MNYTLHCHQSTAQRLRFSYFTGEPIFVINRYELDDKMTYTASSQSHTTDLHPSAKLTQRRATAPSDPFQ
ncbi:hypothetical protein FD724_35815 (plasmid) [Nostoc sp. C057]|uniref:hypothetical protein n=1 Tax=Nostoc sp. C057 TaxID=2576903 RepID=UPI0015C376F0|nr:hypothetical protein [Nostoc sp. C057]QLE53283.1 hypothetical protein FD724_35815 [Nostoc sp. C057]